MLSAISLVLAVVTILCFIAFHKWHYGYWYRRQLRCIPAKPIVGNVWNLISGFCCFGEQFKNLYDHPKAKDQPFVGIHVLFNRALLIRDPELIKCVLVKNFRDFSNRFETTDAVGDSMGSLNLFFAKYEYWKEMHRIFSPFFAANRIKLMYPLIIDISLKLEQYLERLQHDCKNNFVIVEVKEMCALFTTDVIASLAFGVEANSLKNPNADFRRMCIEVNEPRLKRLVHLFVMFFFPSLANFVGTHLYSLEYEKFMRDTMAYVIEKRLETGEKRGDLIDAFVGLIKDESISSESVVHKKDFYVAHAAFLTLAGFDTSSSTITFALYELARNQNIQRYLRKEILNALSMEDGNISYENLNRLEYLDCVVKEVLRMYPPTAFLDRCCSSDEGYDLTPFGDFRIPKSMPVYISVLGLHYDQKYWPNAESFIPERFSFENSKQINPMAYLPFGAGPRGCIGSLIGMLEVKLGLIHILKNYYVEPCNQTHVKIKFAPKAFVLTAEGGTYLKFVKDTKP